MLTGEKLGEAIRAAIKMKRVPQTEVARHFDVKPPSIQDWMKRGTIGKEKLPALWEYFADVAGPTHWGLQSFPMAAEARRTQAISIEHVREKLWPYPRVDYAKFVGLTGSAARGMENAILAAAGDLGVEVKTSHAANHKQA